LTLIVIDTIAYFTAKSKVRKERTMLRLMIEEARLAGLVQPESRVAYHRPNIWGVYLVSIPVTVIGLWLHPFDYYLDLQGVEIAWFFFPFVIMLGYIHSWYSPTYKVAIFSPARIDTVRSNGKGSSKHKMMRWKDVTVNISYGESLDVSLTDGTFSIYQHDFINSLLVWYFLQKYAPEKIPDDGRLRDMVKAAFKWYDKHPQIWP
jgi:hypothetical protein